MHAGGLTRVTRFLQAVRKRSAASLMTEKEVAADLARVNPEIFEQSEVRGYLDLFAHDDLTEDVLKAIQEEDDDAEAPATSITDADLKELDDLLDKPVGALRACMGLSWRVLTVHALSAAVHALP